MSEVVVRKCDYCEANAIWTYADPTTKPKVVKVACGEHAKQMDREMTERRCPIKFSSIIAT